MSNPRHHGSGFSSTSKQRASKTKATRNFSNHIADEHKAAALINQGKLQEAEVICKQLIEENTENHISYCNLAAVYGMQGRLNECIGLLKKALKLKPNLPENHYNLGNALKDQGALSDAINAYNTALKLKPNYPEAQVNLGIIFKAQGDLDAAITSFNNALQLKPNDPQAHFNLGNTLGEKGDLDNAITSFKIALQLKPNYAEAHINLGNTLREKGDLDNAISSFKIALQLKPNYAEAHWNLALTMLLKGNYKNGWGEYEWRAKMQTNESKPHSLPKCDQWNNEPNTNHSNQLLLISEQGLGDTLQFMRYAEALRNEGISVSLCAQPKLHNLIRASGIDPSPLTPIQANQVDKGQWMPLLSLPKHLGVSPSNPIITEPYIKTTEELITKWSNTLGATEKPIIGINWQGNPKAETNWLQGRSLSLDAFAPITRNTQISLLSLQKGFGSEQLETCSFKDRFVSAQTQINDTWDFLETAAIITNCDLIITTDTSVAHLAGGMGKTTWLLLHHIPDWRWGLEGDTTFWYPSMRLFRQKERGNWNAVMKRVAESLQEHFENISAISEPTANNQPLIKPAQIKEIHAPISLGELVDKITILQIKTKHLQDSALENTEKELKALKRTLDDLNLDIKTTLIQRLKKVNQTLWKIEDDIRDQERQKNFGEEFIQLARSVYQQNDIRAAIKKEINTAYGSALVEEKSYQQY